MKPYELPSIIESEKIFLRKLQDEDAQLMFNEINQDRKRLGVFLPWVELIKTLDDEKEFVRQSHKKWLNCTEFKYAIFSKNPDTYVGAIGVHSICWKYEKAEIGYWILGEHEGKGLILEATKRLTQILFHHGFHRVQIRCGEKNIRSAKVPERAGFDFEGLFVDDAKLAEGLFVSHLMFSKINIQRR